MNRGHNLGHSEGLIGCKLLTPIAPLLDSQSSNPGSIPGSATSLVLSFTQRDCLACNSGEPFCSRSLPWIVLKCDKRGLSLI